MAVAYKKLVDDLREIATRVEHASYYTEASQIKNLADNIEGVFLKPPCCSECGKPLDDR